MPITHELLMRLELVELARKSITVEQWEAFSASRGREDRCELVDTDTLLDYEAWNSASVLPIEG